MQKSKDCLNGVCIFCTQSFNKDVEELSKDKNCIGIDFYKKIILSLVRNYKRGISLFQHNEGEVVYRIEKVRVKHPCIKKGKRGGLRLFYAFIVKPTNPQGLIHIILLRLIYKPYTENLTDEEIIEALQSLSKDSIYQFLFFAIKIIRC